MSPCECRELPVRRLLLATAAACFLALPCAAVSADLVLPSIFADHMVLQRSASTPVWGRSTPGQQVTVRLGDDVVAESTPDADGRWRVSLDTSELPAGPHVLRIDDRTINDVLIGEVWLCGGQSNMEFVLADTLGAKEEIEGPPNSQIRQFHVPKRAEQAPVADLRGTWMEAGPSDTGRFTAIGYHFAKNLHRELGVPIGLVNVTWGGSACETWMSPDSVGDLSEIAEGARKLEEEIKTYPERRKAFAQSFHAWVEANDRQDRRTMTVEQVRGVPEDQWTHDTLPRPDQGPAAPGAIWFRRTVEMPEAAAGKPLRFMLGTMQMLEEAWWNGEKVGETTVETFEAGRYGRQHDVPGKLVLAGPNELLVRLWSPARTPHFMISPEYFRAGRVPLSGAWLTLREYSLAAPATPPPAAPIELPWIQNVASRAFNGMISPLLPYGIAGVIWYQGENNSGRASQYHAVFPALIRDWRKAWERDDLPFFWCQLANYREKPEAPGESSWAELREAQTKTLALPATGQVVTIDVGETGDIHPRNKAVPGQRLADLALAGVYGRERPASGPTFDGVEFGGGKAVVRFRDTAGGLVAAPLPEVQTVTSIPPQTAPLRRNRPHSPLEGFAVRDPAGSWRWADAVVEGDTVVVWNPQVPEPVAVRYAWADNPTVNLQGRSGLPAVPFRTDDAPLTTAGRNYP